MNPAPPVTRIRIASPALKPVISYAKESSRAKRKNEASD
jgi:hypothetical protein